MLVRKLFNPQSLISHLTNSNGCGNLQLKVLLTVSPTRPYLPRLQLPLESPTYAKTGGGVIVNCSRRFRPSDVQTRVRSVPRPAPTRSGWQTPCSQQFAASLSLLPLFFSLPSFVFNSLQPLFAKYRGWGVSRMLSTFRCAFCIPNVFTGPLDVQTFRRGCASVATRIRHRSHGGVARRQRWSGRKMRNRPKLLKTFSFQAVVLQAVWPRECLSS